MFNPYSLMMERVNSENVTFPVQTGELRQVAPSVAHRGLAPSKVEGFEKGGGQMHVYFHRRLSGGAAVVFEARGAYTHYEDMWKM